MKVKTSNKSPLIPKHGGYRNLKSFQVAQLAYDVTVRFCERYISKFSRTRDQMVQAARSGVQNIAEGSMASGTSKKTELKLTNVARASLEELRLDYQDYLRQRGLTEWPREHALCRELVGRRFRTADEVAQWVKEVRGRFGQVGHCGQKEESVESKLSIMSKKSILSNNPTYDEIAANAALVLIGVAITLLGRQLETLANNFTQEGGFTEKLYKVRSRVKRSFI